MTPNEKTMVLTDRPGQRHSQATWWWIGQQWKCVGAMRPLVRIVPYLPPERAAEVVNRAGYRFEWINWHNPSAPPVLLGISRKKGKKRHKSAPPSQTSDFRRRENEQIAKWRKEGVPGYAQ